MIATCNIDGPNEFPKEKENRYVHTFKTGFSIIRREVFTELVGFFPNFFFRSGGEAYLSTALWDMGFRVLQVANVTMYHEQTSISRDNWDWNYYGHRSQNAVLFMRSPWYLIPSKLLMKFMNGFIATIRTKASLFAWARSWTDLIFLAREIRAYRKPISGKTELLLQILKNKKISTPQALEEVVMNIQHPCAQQITNRK
jgi:GT2 family glycosyltransferase